MTKPNDEIKQTPNKVNEINHLEILHAILDSAYEGICVIDKQGVVQEFNQAYSRILGKDRDSVIGRKVEEVIDNTRLHIVVQTGIPERGEVQRIQGHDMVVHRIPIIKDNEVIGAVGMLIFEGVSELYKILERAQHLTRTVAGGQTMLDKKHKEQKPFTFDQILGDSVKLTAVKKRANRAAQSPSTVLIIGESGTGKELFARSIHYSSAYAEGPFISVNCSAIPEHLLESELFGYEEGAFTGARKGGKPGKFEVAHNGTLFLDEIGDMPLAMQAKLLRVLQERVVERVGGNEQLHIDVRIVAATNRNLEEMVELADFRSDLYYRLNIISIQVPPLRERKEDIPLLIEHYLEYYCKRNKTQAKYLHREALAILEDYSWPGNIRELVNIVEMLVSLVESREILPVDLPVSILTVNRAQNNSAMWRKDVREEKRALVSQDYDQDQTEKLNGKTVELIQEMKERSLAQEKEVILQVLREAGGNKAKAARILGIHRSTLYEKLNKFNLV
jgi:transcriptional regulator with PAS, ATPase and Fis domain